VAVFGTTISPYLFFWQASQEVEEQHLDPNAHALRDAPDEVKTNFRRIKIDTYVGMGFSNLVAFFIILTTAVTLHSHGVTGIHTSGEAALALRPIAGKYAFLLFSAGIIGTGLLAIPVLAGSSAYAFAEAFDWPMGLERKLIVAKRFYGIIAFSIVGGLVLGFTKLDPIKALYWSAVVNGVISVPIMSVMMLMAVREDIMGTLVIRKKLQFLGWLAVAIMTAVIVAMFVL
jgi:Mn2+/Fe2+ NRAMP family transporter